MKKMKTPRGTARRLRRAALDYAPRATMATENPEGAALHRLAASLA